KLPPAPLDPRYAGRRCRWLRPHHARVQGGDRRAVQALFIWRCDGRCWRLKNPPAFTEPAGFSIELLQSDHQLSAQPPFPEFFQLRWIRKSAPPIYMLATPPLDVV